MATRRQRSNNRHNAQLLAVPWWVWLLLAGIIFFLLHFIASMNLSGKPPGAVIALSAFKSVASVLRYFVPIPFVFMAAASAFRSLSARPSELRYEYGQSIEPSFSPRHEQPKPDVSKALTLDLLCSLDWRRFEETCAEYFRCLNFHAITQSHGPDGGVDIQLAHVGEPGRIVGLVQCKQWAKPVGPKLMREFLGVMVDAKVDGGIFITTSTFVPEARSFGIANKIDLIDGERLVELINARSPAERSRILAVATDGDYLTPTCVACGIKMVRRNGDAGAFWGCSNFPRCRKTMEMAEP